MKFIFILAFLLPALSVSAQYSNYYNINKNVDVSGNLNINTIDYGRLALANAEREKNRLLSLQYSNDIERQHAIEIASNPMKAFDYGIDNVWEAKGVNAQNYGFNKFTWYLKIPHPSLFVRTDGYKFRNVSENNIITEIEIWGPLNINGIKDQSLNKQLLDQWSLALKDPEEYAQFNDYQVGTVVKELDEGYLHKKDINKAKLYNIDGFKGTLIFETKYENIIKDNYVATINGIVLTAGVRYKGDKDEVSFEDLEGRRYYLKKLCEQIIATSNFTNIK